MKNVFTIILSLFCFIGKAQDIQLTAEEINAKLDSILLEGNLLFRYENASWISTDLAYLNEDIKRGYGRYFTYEANDTIKTIIIDVNKENCIAEYGFSKGQLNPGSKKLDVRKLTSRELRLLEIENKIRSQITDPKYGVAVPEGFSLNMILIPGNTGYRFYIITGTTQSNVIPFGNDHLFETDAEGNVKDWKKFHSRLIPQTTTVPNGAKLAMAIHSHLRTSPFISATDICTFKLYGKLFDLERLSVYSPAFGKYFEYNSTTNKISVKGKD